MTPFPRWDGSRCGPKFRKTEAEIFVWPENKFFYQILWNIGESGNTPRASPKPSALPKLDLEELNSDYYYEYDSLSGSEYSGTEYDLHSQPTTARL